MSYDPERTDPERLSTMIADLGYEVEEVDVPQEKPADRRKATTAPLPKNAPVFLREAYARSRKENKVLVLDFWATWCGPCIRLKKETLHDPDVEKLLGHFELLFIDLDAHPELAKAYGVESVPDLVFVAPDGRVLDRLRRFEPPRAFRKRLERILHPKKADATDESEDRDP